MTAVASPTLHKAYTAAIHLHACILYTNHVYMWDAYIGKGANLLGELMVETIRSSPGDPKDKKKSAPAFDGQVADRQFFFLTLWKPRNELL